MSATRIVRKRETRGIQPGAASNTRDSDSIFGYRPPMFSEAREKGGRRSFQDTNLLSAGERLTGTAERRA